jgi:hypothetical protein
MANLTWRTKAVEALVLGSDLATDVMRKLTQKEQGALVTEVAKALQTEAREAREQALADAEKASLDMIQEAIVRATREALEQIEAQAELESNPDAFKALQKAISRIKAKSGDTNNG